MTCTFLQQSKTMPLTLKRTRLNCARKKEESLFSFIAEQDSVKALSAAEDLKHLLKPRSQCVDVTNQDVCVLSSNSGT